MEWFTEPNAFLGSNSVNCTKYKFFAMVLEKVFVQVYNDQGCGTVIAKTVLLLTQPIVFGKIIVKSYVQHFFKYF